MGCEEYKQDDEIDAQHNCPVHRKPCVHREEENFFFGLSSYQQQLEVIYPGKSADGNTLVVLFCPLKPAHDAAATLLEHVSLLEMASPLYNCFSTVRAARLPAISQLAFPSSLYCKVRLFCLKQYCHCSRGSLQ